MTRTAWKITRDMFLSCDEVETLLAGVSVDKKAEPVRIVDRVIIEGLLWSGLRSTEFCRLQLSDFEQKRNAAVFVIRERRKIKRKVHLPAELVDVLSHYVKSVRPIYLPDGVSPADLKQPLVLNDRRRAYERTGLYRRVVRVLKEHGLGDRASVQLLRHTYGYLAYRATGGNLLFVQRQLGHAHPMVTAVYEQFVAQDYSALADQVETMRRSSRRVSKRLSTSR